MLTQTGQLDLDSIENILHQFHVMKQEQEAKAKRVPIKTIQDARGRINWLNNLFPDTNFDLLWKDRVTAIIELSPDVLRMAHLPKPVDTQLLIDKCIDLFINLYINSKQIVNELGIMQESNPEVMQYFATYEDMILEALVKAFDNPNVSKKDLTEKMYLLYTLADILGHEHAFRYHASINLDVLRQQISTMIAYLFSK